MFCSDTLCKDLERYCSGDVKQTDHEQTGPVIGGGMTGIRQTKCKPFDHIESVAITHIATQMKTSIGKCCRWLLQL